MWEPYEKIGVVFVLYRDAHMHDARLRGLSRYRLKTDGKYMRNASFSLSACGSSSNEIAQVEAAFDNGADVLECYVVRSLAGLLCVAQGLRLCCRHRTENIGCIYVMTAPILPAIE